MSSLKNYIWKAIGFGVIVCSPFLSVDNAFTHEVKIFWNPRINGLKVDRCVDSYQYPDGCSANATNFAADNFCNLNGYSSALSWEYVDDSSHFINDYKLLDERGNTQFRLFNFGANVFTGIACQR
jgi:hypothetical protein